MKRVLQPPVGCWEWQGKSKRISRRAYELFVGEIPEGMWVLHSCDNPKCVNPEHLFLGTAQENQWDRLVKGR